MGYGMAERILIRIREAVGPRTKPYVRLPLIPAGLLRCSALPSRLNSKKLPGLAGRSEAV
jgi:hypothetical protein